MGIIMNCRVLKNGKCVITQKYHSGHKAIDLVGDKHTLDYIVSHSDGEVTYVQDGYNNKKGSTGGVAYGNYVKIKHNNEYSTLYAHLEKGIKLKKGDMVSKGMVIGYMSDSGNAYGKHLHFEVFRNGKKIDPTKYINDDIISKDGDVIVSNKYKVGMTVKINGVFVSSTSNEKLVPLIKEGKITKIISGVRNPYLLNDGNIGWVNDDSIIENVENQKYLMNSKYIGNSIVDALKGIGVDSSFVNRKKLAEKNNINNYVGSAKQNIEMLNLLKKGKLKGV